MCLATETAWSWEKYVSAVWHSQQEYAGKLRTCRLPLLTSCRHLWLIHFTPVSYSPFVKIPRR